ncbi:MAG TPA: redoxin family protein, partial [Tepidisphaeraceae bacterium]|nr:redoxin family protein [Tepidisphaeraceae bacterium]
PARILSSLAIILSLLVTSTAQAQLKIGDPAPPIKVSKFIKGTPVTSFEPGKVYVIELWATWCGPCIRAMPHLSELQQKYRDQGVTFIGTSVQERDVEQAKVEPFVTEAGEMMSYTVAMDDRSDGGDGAMVETWLRASGERGIPKTFLVDQKGRLVWIGRPSKIEPILKEVLAGTYDLEKQMAMATQLAEFKGQIQEARKAEDWDKAIALYDEGAQRFPDMVDDWMMQKFQTQLSSKNDVAAAYETAEELMKSSEDAMTLGAVAWTIATRRNLEPRNLDLAKRVAQKAVELTNSSDPSVIDTLARVHFLQGDIDKAIELQTQVVEISHGPLKTRFQKTLDEYKAAKK